MFVASVYFFAANGYNANGRVSPLSHLGMMSGSFTTPGRRRLKTLSTIDTERGSKIDRNSVFDCHLSPVGRQMAIENTVSINYCSTFLDSIGVFDCRPPGVS